MTFRYRVALVAFILSCGGGKASSPTVAVQHAPAIEVVPAPREATPAPGEPAPAAARAEAGGWSAAGLEAPPHYCNESGGTEWCDGSQDDDCDGFIDEGCVDCVNQKCERFTIPAEKFGSRGPGERGPGQCVGPIYCGRLDGYATTTPPGGCGAHHCGTTIYPDGKAKPNGCTIVGRCEDGKFEARSFTW